MANLTGRSLTQFRRRLMEWYARHKRAMPWRGTRDAYRVWVSEIMLQQTRVAAVLPYYRRFVKKFPTVRALARARSEEVLKLWAGLGYYSRARNLHRAAREIVARHNGKFPRKYEAALALPGVGRYTAAAVLSIAYGEPLAVVDGNVARVLARLGGTRGDVRKAGRWRRLEERAQELMPAEKAKIEKRKTKNEKREKSLTSVPTQTVGTFRPAATGSEQAGRELQAASFQQALLPSKTARSELRAARREQAPALHAGAGEWNQAMMELGATVCTPRAPRCGECPVARWCKAKEMGIAERIPLAREKRATEQIEIAAAVLVDAKGRTVLVKPEKTETNGLFSGMWQFPAAEVKRVASDRQMQNLLEPQMNADKRRWEKKRGKDLTQRTQRGTENTEKNGDGRNWVALAAVKHSVTFREITLRPFLMRVRVLPKMDGARVVQLEKLEGIAVSNATKKIARRAMEEVRK